MQETPPLEEHIELSPVVRDIIVGMSDGLTVPFAIAAGLASASLQTTTLIVAAVLAEIAAGSISMGLGGYLASKTEAEHYVNERAREEWDVVHRFEREKKEMNEVFSAYGLTIAESAPVVEALSRRPKQWVDFMMKFELGLEEPNKRRALQSAFFIGGAYTVGGLIPLTPYLLWRNDVHAAFIASIGATAIALVVFGFVRARVIRADIWRSMLQTLLVGGLAATAAFLLAELVA